MVLYVSLRSLSPMFQPKSVAVIGASDRPGRIGFEVVKSLVKGGFSGSIYPVNPRLTNLLGLPAFPSVEALPAPVDLAIVILRKERVFGAVEACGRKGVRAVIVMSSGFSELGDEEAERRLAGLARQWGMRMLGPNCAGFAATWEGVYASFESRIKKGHIAFLSQSGAMCAVVLALARAEGLGLSFFISYGNAADVGPEELLRYLEGHSSTRVVSCYVEGLKHARRFLNAASSLAPRKPVVVLKPGGTQEAARAIKSHTGALAGEQVLYEGAFRQAGVLQAHSLEEFIDACKVLSTQPLPMGNRVAIVTNSGGPGVLAVDACARAGLKVPPLSPALSGRLASFLPPVCPVGNPVDVGPESGGEAYRRVVEELLASPEVDMTLVVCVPPVFADISDISRAVVEARKRNPANPLITCWLAGDIVEQGLPILSQAGIPNFPTPRRAASALTFLLRRAQWLRSRGLKAQQEPPKP